MTERLIFVDYQEIVCPDCPKNLEADDILIFCKDDNPTSRLKHAYEFLDIIEEGHFQVRQLCWNKPLSITGSLFSKNHQITNAPVLADFLSLKALENL